MLLWLAVKETNHFIVTGFIKPPTERENTGRNLAAL
jgi:hypothetical protein